MDNTNNSISFIKRYKQKYVIYIQTHSVNISFWEEEKRKIEREKEKNNLNSLLPSLSLSLTSLILLAKEYALSFITFSFTESLAIPKITISVILSCRVSTLQSIPSSPQILHFIARIFYVYPLKKKEKSPSVSCPKQKTKFPLSSFPPRI